MKREIRALSILLTLYIFSSCSDELDEKSYIKWVKDYENGLHVKKESGAFLFDLQYTPVDYMWLQYKNAPKENLAGLQYYTLTVSPIDQSRDFIEFDVQSEGEKQRKLYYFSYSFQNAIRLEEGGKTFPCVLYHFERPVDLKNGRTFMLGFASESAKSAEAKLVIESEYFGSLPLNIKVSKNNIPALAL